MSIVDDIRARLDEAHPVIYRQVDDDRFEIVGNEREALLDEWAQTAYDEALARLRERRNALLAASDWTQVNDAPTDAAAWAEYRRALRDLPANTPDPEAVTWPEVPA